MNRLTLIIGRAGTGKTSSVMRSISEAVARREAGQLLLVPEQYSHEAEKELCRVCGDGLSLYGETLSFTRLASLAEEELGLRRPTLDEGGRLMAMRAALGTLDGRLSVFSAAPRRPELMDALLRAVTELKTALATPDDLLEASAHVEGALREKLRDLSLVAQAYDAVTSRGGAEPFDRLTRLAEAVPRTSLCRNGHLYVDGFSDFTAQETAVLAALMGRGADMTVCLTLDALEGGSEIFDLTRATARRLLAEARERGMETRVERLEAGAERAGALRFLEKHLFEYTSARTPSEGAVSLCLAPDETSECALAAARCLELVREKGCRWRDISVVARGFEHYAQTLRSVFDYYGVPLYLGRRESVAETPLLRFVSAAFEVLATGWDGEAVLDWLKTGLRGVPPEALDELENYALQWSLHGSVWTREEAWKLSPAGFSDGADSAEAQSKLAELDALRRSLLAPLAAYEKAAAAAGTAQAHARAFAAFLAEADTARALEERAASLRGRGMAAEAGICAQLWETLVSALEQFALALGETPMDRETFGALLCAMLARYNVGTIPAVLDAVTAGDLDRMRRRSLRHLIVLGATDERLPAPEPEDPLLSAEERETLVSLGVGLRDPRGDGLWRELSLVYNAFTLPSETLTLVCPERADGSPARPSQIFARVGQLTGETPAPFDRAAVLACAPESALTLAAEGGGGPAGAARRYFEGKPEYASRIAALQAAGSRTARGRLSRESVRALYGETPRVSPTRAENLSRCAYADFLQYGLRAKPRRRAELDPLELGKFMHYVLENVCREAASKGGFAALDDAARDALTDEYVARYISEVLHDFKDKTPRFVYLFNRLTHSVRRVVADMAAELAVSDFRPLDFELKLDGLNVTLRQGEDSVRVTGTVDRVDGWLSGGKLWLRVVDYKTGKKAFSLSDVWYGSGLQMLLYLFTLGKTGAQLYGHEVAPAGVLYIPARDVTLHADRPLTDEEAAAERQKALRRSGLLLRAPEILQAMEHGVGGRYLPVKLSGGELPDSEALCGAEQLGQLARHVENALLALARELRHGNIEARPAWRGENDNACLWCQWREVCRFDPARDRKNRRYKLKAEEVWDKIGQETAPADAESC